MYDKYDWNELPKKVLMAANVLGYTQHIWDNDSKSPLDSKDWKELTKKQQKAASILGYTQITWDDDDEDDEEEEDSEDIVALGCS